VIARVIDVLPAARDFAFTSRVRILLIQRAGCASYWYADVDPRLSVTAGCIVHAVLLPDVWFIQERNSVIKFSNLVRVTKVLDRPRRHAYGTQGVRGAGSRNAAGM